MVKALTAAIVLVSLLGACNGGGGNAAQDWPIQPPDPCKDLGYGTAPAGLVDRWSFRFADYESTLFLFPNGTFVDRENTGEYPGFWGVDEAGTISVVYSYNRECPPTGTVMTATGVTDDATTIEGTIVSSPMYGLAGRDWGISR